MTTCIRPSIRTKADGVCMPLGTPIIFVAVRGVLMYERREMSDEYLNADSGVPPDLPLREDPVNRRRWRVSFWLIFLLTPVAAILASIDTFGMASFPWTAITSFVQSIAPGPLRSGGVIVVGAFSAGYCLTKLHAKPKTTLGIGLVSIAFGAGLIAVYGAILFVGCFLVLSGISH